MSNVKIFIVSLYHTLLLIKFDFLRGFDIIKSMIINFKNMSLEFPHKLVKKVRREVAEASAEKEKHREESMQEIAERQEFLAAKKLMDEGATFSRRGEIARQVHRSRTPIGDQFPHGPRGGKSPELKGGLKWLR